MAFFFNNTSANHVRLFIKTDEREKKAKTLKPFSLFSFLSLIIIIITRVLKRQRRRTPCFFILCYIVLTRKNKKRRVFDFDCFAHPEAAAKNPKLEDDDDEELFIIYKHLSLSLD